ncbi:MAG TPA: DUF4349 domain-containing protein [Solirubrobacteraceae bacterium]
MTEPSEITSALAVIDATLAGEAVEPEYAELAELSLILAATGEAPSPEFAAELDRRVERRFAPVPAGGTGQDQRDSRGRRSRWAWLFAPGAAAVGVAAIIALVVVFSGGSARNQPLVNDISSGAASRAPSAAQSSTSAASSPGSPSSTASTPSRSITPAARAGRLGLFSGGAGDASAPNTAPSPATSGRQIVQSAQLSLSTPPARIDDVAQQVFDVVAAQNGVVENSNVTSTAPYGNAQFSLSVPSANLSRTLNSLSQLHGAHVVSRSDATQDITGQVGGAGRRLAEDRALRTSLLRQLAAATTTTAVNSLKAQIRDVDASINRDLSALRTLQRKVAYSQISVTINSVALPVHPVTHGGGFTLSRALHDAGRVLVVAAGVGLIVLAALVPLGLVVALGLWLAAALRRRRREQVLDLL